MHRGFGVGLIRLTLTRRVHRDHCELSVSRTEIWEMKPKGVSAGHVVEVVLGEVECDGPRK
jgi:hypothetical protein